MNFDLGTAVPIIIAILGIVGGAGFWQYRISRRDAPVRKQEADMAVAEKSQQMAMKIAERLDLDYTSVRGDLGVAETAITALQKELKTLETRTAQQERTIGILRQAVQAFSDAWDDLVQHWDHYRLSDTPPKRPTHSLDFE